MKDAAVSDKNLPRWVAGFTIIVVVLAAILTGFNLDIYRVLGGLLGAFSIVAVLYLAGLAAVIVVKMTTGTIDLKYLVSDENGDASLSRFQMLLFTFVIAALYFLYSVYALYAMRASTACPGGLTDSLSALGQATSAAQDAIKNATVNDAITKLIAQAKSMTDGGAGNCRSFQLPDIPTSVLGLLGISGGSYLLSKGIAAAAGPTQPAPVPAVAPGGAGAKQWPGA